MRKFTFLLFTLFFVLSSYANKETNKKPESDLTQKKDTTENIIAKARKIHDNVLTIDTHVDFDVRNFTEEKNYTQELPIQVDLPKMKAGGLDAVFLIVYTGQGELNEEGYKKAYANADAKFRAIHRLTENYAPDQIELATTADDVRRIAKSGKKIALIGIENGRSEERRVGKECRSRSWQQRTTKSCGIA